MRVIVRVRTEMCEERSGERGESGFWCIIWFLRLSFDHGNVGGGELKSVGTKFIGLSWEKDQKGYQEIRQYGLVRAF